jgi:uncharacterized protein YacL
MQSNSPSQLTGSEKPSGTSALVMYCLRGVFALALVSVGMSLASNAPAWMDRWGDTLVVAFLVLAVLVILLDVFIPRKSLYAISGVFFGLIVGLVVTFGVVLILNLIVEAVFPDTREKLFKGESVPWLTGAKLAIGVICCYLAVSFVLQTKDDVRFVIPYVEFSKQTKGARPLVLDTSVIIDGRIADISETRIIDSELIIPRFVLLELQNIADSGDKVKRTRGRRGLDMLNKLQTSDKIEIRILDAVSEKGDAGVDEMLVDLAVEINGRVVTNDYNLNKIAQLRGATVININDLANALKPVVLPGETMPVKVIKAGEEVGQGVGYLEDGTMVVVESGREHIGETISIAVTSVLQTSAGRMIFGRIEGAAERRQPRQSRPSQ